jgi:sugar (pentulose or hexulose) kinase
MAGEDLLLGVDAGLTNLAAVVFDRSGTPLATASRETPRREPAPGREEVAHDDLWAATAGAVSAVLDDDAVDPGRLRGVGLAGHGHGLYALDAAGDPVYGVRSTDDRGTAVLESWREDGRLAAAADRLGWEPFGADPYCLLGWAAREDPATADRVDTLLFCKDVLAHRLTGERATDAMDGSALVPSDGDAAAVFETLGVGEFAGAVPDVRPSTAVAGTVTGAAAATTGIPEGTPVAAGLHDVGACAFGAGATAPGEATVVLGTWGQSVLVTDGPDDGEGGLPRRYLDGWLRYRGTRAGAACLDWFVDAFGGEWRREARRRGLDPYEVYEERAAAVPAGAGGVLFHPYLKGSTDDPTARGGFYGLGADHTATHLLRAVYEGVALALTLGVEAFDRPVDRVRLTGGGARSDVWAGVFADAFGTPVEVPAVAETGALGAALCGGVAAGVYDSAAAAADAAVAVDRTHRPEADAHDRYRALAEAFERARRDMGATWERLMTASPERGDG